MKHLVKQDKSSERLVSERIGFERVMGRHGTGSVNENGERLQEFCDFNEMVITGTIFHKEMHKLTWMPPDGKMKNPIGHSLVNRNFRTSVISRCCQ